MMNDLIRRQDAIDAVFELSDKLSNEMLFIDAIVDEIENLPSAEPERKKGKWNFIGDNMFECTHCRVVYTTQQLNGLRNYAEDPYAPRFCPNCGTRMEIRNNE